MAGIATRNSARLILGVQRSGVPVHSAAVHVPVHEKAILTRMIERGSQVREGEAVYGYGYVNENGDGNGYGDGDDEPSGQPEDAGDGK